MAEPAVRRTVDGEFIKSLDRPPLALQLGLEPHPEGGWYARTWTSPHSLEVDGKIRPAATLILFLLPAGEASAWHRVSSTEFWIWNGLGPIALELGGSGDKPATDASFELGERMPQLEIPAGTWQRTLRSGTDSLASCMVSPGFSFDDFVLA